MKHRITIISLLLLLLAGCEDIGSLEVYLVKSPNAEEDPLDPVLVTHIRLTVFASNLDPIVTTTAYEPGSSAELPNIPAGNNRILVVEGLAGENGYPISRGRSLPFQLKTGKQSINLFIARTGRFSFTPGYGLETARFAHGTALDHGGRLWIVGGSKAGAAGAPLDLLSSVEQYDPTSGDIQVHSCQEISSNCLSEPKAYSAVAPTGSDLYVYGGYADNGPSSTIERIDTKNKTFSTSSTQAEPRQQASVALNSDYTVISGGLGEMSLALDTVEVVDSKGQKTTTQLPEAKRGHSSAFSLNQVFIFGGYDEDDLLMSDYFLFDPEGLQTQRFASNAEARAYANAVSFADGRVLVFGGINQDSSVSGEVALFDPRVGVLCPIGQMLTPRWRAAAVALSDSRALVMGGLVTGDTSSPTHQAEILDARFVELESDCSILSGELKASLVPNFRVARYEASATYLPNDTVALVGGLDAQGAPVHFIEVFLPIRE